MKTKNRLYIILHIIIGIAAAAIVPAGVFFIQIPDYVTIFLCSAFFITFILCFKQAVQKPVRRIVLTALSLLAIIISILGNYCNPYWNSINFKENISDCPLPIDTMLTKKEAEEDLEYVMHYLKKLHPAFYKDIPAQVKQRYEAVLADFNKAETISICELSQKTEYIFSVMRDAHSYVKYRAQDPHYMKDIYQFNQKNDTITAINGISLADLLKQTEDLYSYEVESWQLKRLKNDLSSLEGLQYLGFSADEGITYTYESEDGTAKDYTYHTKDFLTYDAYAAYNQITDMEQEEEQFVYYEIDPTKNLAILTLNSCNYNDEYTACLQEMFTKIKEAGIHNVAVDLRDNGGGNSLVADEFIRYLDVDTWNTGSYKWRFGWFQIPSGNSTIENKKYHDLTFTGNVYILTSANSFSSAMLFPQYIKDNHMGTIIGEAPGNTPNGYGDIAMFTLPNSKLFMQISTKEFFRIDGNNPDNLIEPDIPCASDDVMEVLYETINPASSLSDSTLPMPYDVINSPLPE